MVSLFSPPKGPCCSEATPPPCTPLPAPTPEHDSPEHATEDARCAADSAADAANIAEANQNLENLFSSLPAGILSGKRPFEAEHDIATSCH